MGSLDGEIPYSPGDYPQNTDIQATFTLGIEPSYLAQPQESVIVIQQR